jgi:hypothetical protein
VSATRGLTLTLPDREADRAHVLAVVTPGCGRAATRPRRCSSSRGRYRFVLANGIDAALLRANGTAPAALAGCSFDWQP